MFDKEISMNIEKDIKQIPVVLAFTASYFIPAAVCITSILEHAGQGERFHFICLLTRDLSDKQKMLLKLLAKDDTAVFSFLDLAGKLDFPHNKRFTDAAYYRLILPDLLPTLDKVFYIDCDTVVQSNIGDLYAKLELEQHYLAGVPELVLDFQKDRLVDIGCDTENYMNSGFLLMNLKKMREDELVPKFLEATKSGKYLFPDQDILNICCAGRIKWIAPRFNSINVFRVLAYKPLFLSKFSARDWLEANQIGTLHYTGNNKPWDSYTLNFETWWQYFRSLPKAIRQETDKNGNFWKMYYLGLFMGSSIGSFVVNLIKRGRG